VERRIEVRKAKIVFGLFVVLAAVQLAVPVSQIWKHEDILATGRAYKFKTAPVDPYDAFRGRYVALQFAGTAAPVRASDKLEYQHAYVRLEEGADGFVRFKELSATPPSGMDYLRVQIGYGISTNTSFELPFDRFYMEESAAPKAEAAYFAANRRGQTNDQTYVVVRVKGGRGVIEDLFVKGKPIRAFLKEQRAASQR
jgi:uncharacterized membrane-anchored protein